MYYRCNTHYPTVYWLEVIVSMSRQTVWVRDSERTWGWLVLSQHVWGPVWEGWKAGADREGLKSSGCSSSHRCGSGAVMTGGAGLLPGLHGLSLPRGFFTGWRPQGSFTSHVAVWAPRESVPAKLRPYHFTVLS